MGIEADPILIQAGMGIGISDYNLANAVSRAGHLGVVSGTAIDTVLVRRLQNGDSGGHIRRALQHFPIPDFAEKILAKYFVPSGLEPHTPFASLPMLTATPTIDQQRLLIIANFVEVYLAKEGHAGKIGINYLEKVQLPILPSLYGAMLAGVDYVLMGAGIPREVPGVLDRLCRHEDVEYKLNVKGAGPEDHFLLKFSPTEIMGKKLPDLTRPDFLAIISSTALAMTLAKKTTGKVNGFIIEAPTAGGHNAPPRGKLQLSVAGEPIYGVRDEPDLPAIASLGLPYWLAGTRGSPEGLASALAQGATGIQVGTAFALCDESGLDREIKNAIIEKVLDGKTQVFTDPMASPTGFPFKIASLENTLSETSVYDQRVRTCDLGYLREPYKKSDATIGYRCASEPIRTYVAKKGLEEETIGRKCLCNSLMANIGLGQRRRDDHTEPPLVTIGDDVSTVGQFIEQGKQSYSALDVIERLLA